MIADVHLAAHAHREVEQPHLLGLLALVQERGDLLARVAVVVGLLGLGAERMRELGEGSALARAAFIAGIDATGSTSDARDDPSEVREGCRR